MNVFTDSSLFVDTRGLFLPDSTQTRYDKLSSDEYRILMRGLSGVSIEAMDPDDQYIAMVLLEKGYLKEPKAPSNVSIWEQYNWNRARRLTLEAESVNEQAATLNHLAAEGKIHSSVSLSDLPKLTTRSCARFFEQTPVPQQQFLDCLDRFKNSIRNLNWLRTFVVIQRVAGLEKQILEMDYSSAANLFCSSRRNYESGTLLKTIQGQWWIGGPGFCIFFSVDFAKLNYSSNVARDYMDVYVRLGEIGQSLLNCATLSDLAGWMTPAVNETIACDVLGITSSSEEPLYFFKLGIRDRSIETQYNIETLEFEDTDLEQIQPYDPTRQDIHKKGKEN